jgi:hypothetical protein
MTTTTTAAQDEVDHRAHIGLRQWQEVDRRVIAQDRREEGSEEAGAAEADEVEVAMDTGQDLIPDQEAGHHAAARRDRRTVDLRRGHHRRGEDMADAIHHRGEADVVEAAEEVAGAEAEEARVTVRTAAEVRVTAAGAGIVDRIAFGAGCWTLRGAP